VTALLPARSDDVPSRDVLGEVLSVGARNSSEPVLAFEGVGKSFASTVAVEDITLSVTAGEFVAVVGPSGCGKSTLLRMASGLTAPSTGRLTVADGDMGYVFQDATLLPWRTVERNLELFGELDGVPKDERRRRARHALELTGLTGFERHRPGQLSGGMRMRVSLARALTLHPRLFLLDEPFGALDEITRGELNFELLRVLSATRTTCLLVTHSVDEAALLGDKIIVLSHRPCTVKLTYEVTTPRELRKDSRDTVEFLEHCRAVRAGLAA